MARAETFHHGICQLTTGHALDDERILHRMAWSAQRLGYHSAVAGPGTASGQYQGIPLIAVYDPQKKAWSTKRLVAWVRLLRWALKSDFRSFQIHDPDLLPAGLVLRLFRRKVIYDVHDDYQASFEMRLASRSALRRWFPKVWWMFERNASRWFNGVIVADKHLSRKFQHCRPTILGNYPRMDFTRPAEAAGESTFNVLYVGGVTEERGVRVALEAIKMLPHQDLRFHVVGRCRDERLLEDLKSEPRVAVHGQVPWTELYRFYERAHLGLAVYQPLPGFVTVDHSVKIIEYMAAGVPLITSDFPGLRRFVAESGVGIVIDPTDPKLLADQIRRFYEDAETRIRLGSRGRQLFESEYHWEKHEPRLAELYRAVVG